jgi:peroxiredoxin Q/BCP
MASEIIGTRAVDFCLPDADENRVCLNDFRGKWVVLYFYPKDNTSGCTLEAVDFTGMKKRFLERNAHVIGVSPDSTRSHCNFRDKHGLQITLLSDPDHTVLEKYGVWVLKKMYGREYHGVERSTFLIDPQGLIRHIWLKVKAKGHVEDVFSRLLTLQEGSVG